MNLGNLIDRLSELDSEDTIYAAEPWTEQSKAVVARESDNGGLPQVAVDGGMKYFLEVSGAQEFVEDWLSSANQPPTPSALRQRIVSYAINDA